MKWIFLFLCINISMMINFKKENRIEKHCFLGGSVAYLVVKPDTILIASDTKQVAFENGVQTTADTVCKIQKKGKIVYAMAGIVASTSPDIDLDKIISALKFDSQTFEFQVYEIKNVLTKPVTEIAQTMKEKQIRLFNELSNSNQLVSLILASFENDNPISATIVFKIQSSSDGTFEIIPTVSCKTEIPRFLCIGHNEALNYAVSTNGVFSNQFGSHIELLNGLVQLQSKYTPKDVGMPADIIEISKDKITWIQKNQKCEY